MNSPEVISLGIGEIFLGRSPKIIGTILGSCVSVCLFSKKQKIGGMIHFALPDRTHATSSTRNDLNFGDSAILFLYQELHRISQGPIDDLAAKIVGGASVMNELVHASSIGDLNVHIARDTLKELGVTIVGEDVGGTSGRKVYFYTESGRLRVSKMEAPFNGTKKKIRALIIDDSKTIRELLAKILNCNDIEVVGEAGNAQEGEKLILSLSPDVITLDIHMPGLDGVSFLKQYLPRYPIPTIMISSINMAESDLVFKALEAGAVDYLQKPCLSEITTQSVMIREKVITAASIKVKGHHQLEKKNQRKISYSSEQKIVAIGASTGGTEAIKAVLMELPYNIPPILIVQHIPPVFSTAFSKRLNELCPFEVREASDGDEVLQGRVLIAPGGRQMELIIDGDKKKVRVFDGEKVNRHRPSVDVLFNSVAKNAGDQAIGVILTGMGNDGAAGLLRMRNAGADTIGQDEESCVVYGMPKAAFDLKAVERVVSLENIAEEIISSLEQFKKR